MSSELTPPVIRVLLADDQALFREALHLLLSVQPGIEVIGEAADGEQAITLAAVHQPDVILMDLQMPVLDGVAATVRLKSALPGCRVIALTTFDDDARVFEALRAGAVGYLLKDVSGAGLVAAIRAAVRGEMPLQPVVVAKVVGELARRPAPDAVPSLSIDALTPREMDILRLMCAGRSNREIAETLVIAEGTVKNHVTHILGKLGARDRTQAVILARERRLV